MVGKNLSHYKILEELGRGGMGIVYKAEDTKLDRTVAIKVLPSAALASEDDRARFYREAKAAAQLHHPHIASVFEIDEAVTEGSKDDDLRPFIVMEFIEGKTLDAKIKEGPFKLEDAVRVASEIASALEAAHKKDIVHRDIKSQNVMMTGEGSAKVLDFGLAQTTASTKLTRLGTTLGTVAYMSPEQARGEEVDGRTDLWSLGAILYEMIAGRHPFPGDYEQALIYSILNQNPEPLTSIRSGIPIRIEQIVERSLEKIADHRYQSAADMISELERSATSVSVNDSTRYVDQGPVVLPTKKERKIGWITYVLIGIVFFLGWFGRAFLVESPSRAAYDEPIRLGFPIPGGIDEYMEGHFLMAISPDGSEIVYSQGAMLHRRSIHNESAEAIPGTSGASVPFYSPDGTAVGFLQDGRFRMISEPGGITTISDEHVDWILGANWGENGEIVFSRTTLGIFSLDISSGQISRVTRPDSTRERAHNLPQLIGGGDHLLYSTLAAGGKWHDARIIHLDRTTGTETVVVNGGSHGTYVPTGHVVFSTGDGVLQAVPYDLSSASAGPKKATGITTSLSYWGGSASYAVSPSGTLIYGSSENFKQTLTHWYDNRGQRLDRLWEPATLVWGLEIESQGSRIATTWATARNDDVYVFESGRMDPQRITTHPGSDAWPVWAPDGSRIIWARDGLAGSTSILMKDLPDGNEIEIYNAPRGGWPRSWSADGKWLLISERTLDEASNIIAIEVDNPQNVLEVIRTNTEDWDPQISPDGNFVAFDSDEDGAFHTHVTTFPESRTLIKIPSGNAQHPRWSHVSNELYFWDGTTLKSAHYQVEPVFSIQEVETLFSVPNLVTSDDPHYAVRPDGSGFLIQELNPDAMVHDINVVLNFFSTLDTEASD